MVYKLFMYIKDTSQIHLEYDSLNKSSQMYMYNDIYMYMHIKKIQLVV